MTRRGPSRLLLAHVLRGIVAVCLGLAIVVGVVTLVGIALAVIGKLDLAGGYGVADLALTAGVTLALLISIGRPGSMALGHVVEIRGR